MSSFTRSEHPSTSAISPKSEGNKGDTSQRPSLGTRSSTSDELSAKGQLPTIAGSPSVQSGLSNDKVLQQQQQAPDPSQTPTRIPRRVGTGSTSPRPSLMSEFGIIDAAEKALNSANSSLQVESENSSRRTSSSASSSRSTAVPKSRSSQTISASAASTSSRTADRQVAAAAPAARHVKRRSLLGSSTEKDTASAAAPLTNRTPARTPRRVSSPATSQQNSASAAPARRTVKSISAATARREANLADDAGKPLRPRVAPPVVPATVSAASKMSKSTTMPSLQVEERKRRESVSAASSRRSTPIDDLEQRADQEMQQYVRRVTSKKLAAGVPSEDIRALFEFPDPTRPTRGMSAKGKLVL